MLSLAIEKRYHQEASTWLKGLTVLQLESIMKIIFITDDFSIFKQEIEKIA